MRSGRESRLATGLVAPVQREIRDTFAELIIKMDVAIAAELRELVFTLRDFNDGKSADLAGLHTSYDRSVAVITNALSVTTSVKVPQTPDCLELMAAFRVLLVAAQSQIVPELKKAVSKGDEGKGKLDLPGKLEVLAAIDRAGKADQQARARFLTAAKEFDRQDKSIR